VHRLILVHCKDGTWFAPNLRRALRVPLGNDPREPPNFEDMVLYHDREARLLFVEYLPFRRLPGGETEIPSVGIVRRPPPQMSETYRIRIEITTDEALTLAGIFSVPLPPDFLPEKPRPHWDRVRRQLSYQGILCRRYPRENAPNQFTILDTFQKAGWPNSIESPFKSVWTLRETIDELNSSLDEASPIRFKVQKGRPAWYPLVAPSFSGEIPSSLR
jgi:hypothetical protein